MRSGTRNRLAGVSVLGGAVVSVSGGGTIVAKLRPAMSDAARAPRVYGPPEDPSKRREADIDATLSRGITLELARAQGKRGMD